MEFDKLANVLPKLPSYWNRQEVATWLSFVHLEQLAPVFDRFEIDGQKLMQMTSADWEALSINNIIRKKLNNWVKEGLIEFENYQLHNNKENVMPRLNRIETSKMRDPVKKQQKKEQVPALVGNVGDTKGGNLGMLIKSYEGNLAAFYVMEQDKLAIGRNVSNMIRSLEVSFEEYHAEIVRQNNKYYLQDMGTTNGTFIKINCRTVLAKGMLIEMGSFMFVVHQIDRAARKMQFVVQHMISRECCQLVICLKNNCTQYTFGRRKTCDFSFDDEHLSGTHAKVHFFNNDFVIEDLLSTNGTWHRLSKPRTPSQLYELKDESIFKVGVTITYQCELKQTASRKGPCDFSSTCLMCHQNAKDILIVPCNHNISCRSCSQDMEVCPICHVRVEDKIKIYV